MCSEHRRKTWKRTLPKQNKQTKKNAIYTNHKSESATNPQGSLLAEQLIRKAQWSIEDGW